MRSSARWRFVSKDTKSKRCEVILEKSFQNPAVTPVRIYSPLNENQAETIRVLVVSREAAVLRQLWALEESSAWQLETAATGWDAQERVRRAMRRS